MSPSQQLSNRRQTFRIANRHGVDMFIVYDHLADDAPLALVAHGLSDVHDSRLLETAAVALLQEGYNVLRWDSTNSWGRSGGAIDRVTLTSVYDDLTDVMTWAGRQPWYRQPVTLVGHSLGAGAGLKYATQHPAGIRQLVLLAPVVAGRLLYHRLHPVIRWLWRLFGRLPEPGHRGKYYRYELLSDSLRYDGRELAGHVTVPVTLLAAEADRLIHVDDVRQLYQALPEQYRQLITVPAADHWFRRHLPEVEAHIRQAVTQNPGRSRMEQPGK